MVQHLKTEIAKGGKIYEAKRHDKHPDHFTVYLGQSDGTRKVFVNVLESTLMDELAEAGQLDGMNFIFQSIEVPSSIL